MSMNVGYCLTSESHPVSDSPLRIIRIAPFQFDLLYLKRIMVSFLMLRHALSFALDNCKISEREGAYD